VLAVINEGNDLQNLISQKQVGAAWTLNSSQSIEEVAQDVINLSRKSGITLHCQQVGQQWFSVSNTALQISKALQSESF
jgi:hypothetical protein